MISRRWLRRWSAVSERRILRPCRRGRVSPRLRSRAGAHGGVRAGGAELRMKEIRWEAWCLRVVVVVVAVVG